MRLYPNHDLLYGTTGHVTPSSPVGMEVVVRSRVRGGGNREGGTRGGPVWFSIPFLQGEPGPQEEEKEEKEERKKKTKEVRE